MLVFGGRNYSDRSHLYACLDRAAARVSLDEVCVGGAPGADQLALEWAIERGVFFFVLPADWDGYGRAAGPRRNRLLLALREPDIAVQFPGGRGTADMARCCARRNIPTWRPQ